MLSTGKKLGKKLDNLKKIFYKPEKNFFHQPSLERIYKKSLDKNSDSCRVLCGAVLKNQKGTPVRRTSHGTFIPLSLLDI